MKYVLLLALCHLVGTAWHEIVGHGLVGMMYGGQIERIVLQGVLVYPELGWHGWAGYGSCRVSGIESETGHLVLSLGGSLSTWLVSVIAVGLLWLRRWRKWPRTVLAFLGIWWIDLLTYTLPSWGIPRSVLWGGFYSEPYEAATALGIPGPLFQALVVGSSAILAGCLMFGLIRIQRRQDCRP